MNNKDIDIKNEYGNFKFRVSPIIINNDRVLVLKAKKFDGYVYPGGHVELGELSIDALKREAKEELGITLTNCNLLCVNENIFNIGEKTAQEIVFYYKCDYDGKLPNTSFDREEIDKGVLKHHKFYWIDIKDLIKEDVRPTIISKKLINNDFNEEMITSDER